MGYAINSLQKKLIVLFISRLYCAHSFEALYSNYIRLRTITYPILNVELKTIQKITLVLTLKDTDRVLQAWKHSEAELL